MKEKMPVLAPDEAHVWTALLPSTLPPDIATSLSADECGRARRFHFPEDYFRYVFAHAVLRDVLSRYLDCPPSDVQFASNPFGKPFVVRMSGRRPPEFNLSHAGRVILVGVCDGRRLGIDVEEIRWIGDLESIAESQFTPRECAFILAQPSGRLERAFFRCWTRKEAYVKALGKGLSIPLNSFDALTEPRPDPLFDASSGSLNASSLQIADLDAPEGYVASVAVQRGITRYVHFEWS